MIMRIRRRKKISLKFAKYFMKAVGGDNDDDGDYGDDGGDNDDSHIGLS